MIINSYESLVVFNVNTTYDVYKAVATCPYLSLSNENPNKFLILSSLLLLNGLPYIRQHGI